jgi:pyruvate dehydrogenase E2 component (dihydrolipoamide acetyltransferase)/2-oxoisovalerate dehydrogenase E2 component (dihydrolipoyl transacylase)
MDFHLPELGEGVYEAELVAWLVKPDQAVKRGQNLMEVLTDKATMEVPAPFAGTITELKAEPGDQVKVGDLVLTYDGTAPARASGGDAPAKATGDGKAKEPANGSLLVAASRSPLRAAPSVRYMARKLGVDLAAVRGTGPEGRILIGDLSAHVQVAEPQAKRAAEPVADYGKPGTRIKLQGLRRRIADHMVLAKKTAPHYSYMDECDATELVRLREALKPAYARAGVKLTYLPFVVKAVVAALKEVPLVNATLDEKAGEIVLHDHYHIGIAVATPAGLIVPVVHDADNKDLSQIAREIDRLSADARAGKSRREDLRGGSFTITSIGSVGGLISTPILNYPEVGILGIGKFVKRPIYDERGSLRPADLVYLSWSFDHRVVDGAVGAVFGNAILKQLQNPLPLVVAQP